MPSRERRCRTLEIGLEWHSARCGHLPELPARLALAYGRQPIVIVPISGPRAALPGLEGVAAGRDRRLITQSETGPFCFKQYWIGSGKPLLAINSAPPRNPARSGYPNLLLAWLPTPLYSPLDRQMAPTPFSLFPKGLASGPGTPESSL